MNKQKILNTARHLVSLLVSGNYAELHRLSNGVRLSVKEIAMAVTEYPATFIMPAKMDFQSLDVVEVSGSNPRTFSVDIDLWSKEEGRSDLTLQSRMIESDDEMMKVEIEDIHVL